MRRSVFAAAGRVVRAVRVPVTVDAEAGYVLSPRELVAGVLEIGAVGCNPEAGADCVYPIGVRRDADIAELPGPVNGNTGDEPDLAKPRAVGVSRVSYGPRFPRAAVAGLKAAVEELRQVGPEVVPAAGGRGVRPDR